MLSITTFCRSMSSRAISSGNCGIAVLGELQEDVVAARDLFDVLVLGDDPVAAVVESTLADRPVRHHQTGADPAQLGELLDRQPLDNQVGVQEVEARRGMLGVGMIMRSSI